MTNAITRQASEQVRRAMEAANSARTVPHFDCLPVHEGEPSHRPERMSSPHYIERALERPALYGAARTTRGHGTHRPPHTRGNCQVSDWFYALRNTFQEPAQPQPRDEECSTEVVAIIAGCYAEGITRSAWKAQLRSAHAEQGPRVTAPAMVFGGKEAPRCASPHDDPLVVEIKVASTIVLRVLIDMGSSVNIITWDCLKMLMHPRRDIIPLVHPILGFSGQEVNPTGMICLLVRFGNKLRSKNLEVDFLVVDVPTAYNGGVLHIRLSTVLMPLLLRSPSLSIQGVGGFVPRVLTLGGRRDKLHLLRVTALIGGPLMLIHIVERGLASSLAPWPGPPQLQPSPTPPLASTTTPSFWLHRRPDQPSAFPNAAAFHRSLHPPGEYLGHGYFLLGDLRGIRSPRMRVKQRDPALIKLVDGHWVQLGKWPLRISKGWLAPEWWGRDP
ncbi:hypothetical protein Cgig2_025021 [Carnegiea gigantea]|uniref:Peptidase A2 domain-containing protein n=1 Tax=Carnegiea gigantea TaxID=171969 RepID=A0A9Q1QBA9_9CARY|nr:hypothetical protein Cgig2_025021 [Carnegiea gigantea]